MALSATDKLYGVIAYGGITLPDGSNLRFSDPSAVANYISKNGEFPGNSIIGGTGGQTYAQATLQFQNASVAADLASSNTATDAVTPNPAPATQNTGTAVPTGTTPTTAQEAANIAKAGAEGDPGDYPIPPAQQKNTAPTNKPGGATADDAKKNSKPAAETVNGETTTKATINPLHAYPSYTYGITLHAMSTADFNKLQKNPKNTKFTATLISSASRYRDQRSEFFKDDFYFDNFKLHTIIGVNANTKSSNAIDVSFDIIEPYGMTLINRLLDLGKKLQIENYLEVPYVLEINFFGYDDSGNAANITNQTKYLPIKLIGMKIRAGVKGTEYQVRAVPYNHQANFYNTQSVKATIEVNAKTVSQYLNNNRLDVNTLISAKGAKKQLDDNAVRVAKSDPTANSNKAPPPPNAQPVTDPAIINAGREGDTGDYPIPPTINTDKGFATAYNAWQTIVATQGNIDFADEIGFVIDDERDKQDGIKPRAIKDALIAIPKNTPAEKTPSASQNQAGANAQSTNNDPSKSESYQASQGDNMNTQVFSIRPGTAINSVIDMVLTNSTYIMDQLINAEKQNVKVDSNTSLSAAVGGKPVNWYKVIPKIELKEFDPARQLFAKKITFYITPYKYYNTREPQAPIAKLPPPVKNYNFLYTGKNIDIINFDMDFNALFFTAIQVDKTQQEVLGKSLGTNNVNKENASKNTDQPGYGNPMPAQSQATGTDQQASAGGTLLDADKHNAAAFRNSIYSQLNGDMLQLKLTILGDPEFIKQDDIFYSPDSIGYTPDKQFVNGTSGSLVMDSGAIYCNVVFKTPADIDETVGLRYYNDKEQTASFSGMYSVQQVESEFRQGKFTQNLTLIRQPTQPADEKSNKPNARNDKDPNNPANNPKQSGNGFLKPSIPALPSIIPTNQDLAAAANLLQNNINVQNKLAGLPLTNSSLTTDPTATTTTQPNQAALAAVATNGATDPIGNNSNATGTKTVGATA